MSSVAVIGTGYVGLTTAVCLSELGHRVSGVDIDEEKIAALQDGKATIYEPGLDDLLPKNLKSGRLKFTTDYNQAIPGAEFVFIAVGTPPRRRGEADLVFVKQAAKSLAGAMKSTVTIVNKSTVPIGTGDIVSRIVSENLQTEIPFTVVSNPEFLREGSAVYDFMHPDRLVFGSHDGSAAQAVADLYKALKARILITDLYTAEMIKYASNAFLATRISFINEIAQICERLGADVKEVAVGMGYDKRIGRAFLDAGLGYGGSCFPKDVRALAHMAGEAGLHPQLFNAVMDINYDQRRLIVTKLTSILGSLRGCTVGILGLAFKPNTDDMREAPSVDIIRWVTSQGAMVQVYDPVATQTGREALEREGIRMETVTFCDSAYEVAQDADALVMVTEWNEFKSLNMLQIRSV